MRIWEPQAGAHKNIFFKKSSFVWLALFLYHVDHPNQHHQQIRITKQISKPPLVLIRLVWIFTGIYQRPNSRATVMRADTASITTPAKPERNFAVTTAIVPVTTAIVPVTTAIAPVEKNMKIRLGIEKNVEQKEKNEQKIKRKKNETKNKKKRNKLEVFYVFWIFQKLAKIGHFGGLRLGTTKNEKKTKKTRGF